MQAAQDAAAVSQLALKAKADKLGRGEAMWILKQQQVNKKKAARRKAAGYVSKANRPKGTPEKTMAAEEKGKTLKTKKASKKKVRKKSSKKKVQKKAPMKTRKARKPAAK
eukprot:gene10345-4116_t